MRAGFSSRVGANQSGGQRRFESHLVVDFDVLKRVGGGEAVRFIRDRTTRGIDMNGAALRSDLRDTGQMLASLGVRRVKVNAKRTRVRIFIGPSSSKRSGSKLTYAAIGAVLNSGRVLAKGNLKNLGRGVRSRRKRRRFTAMAARAERGNVKKGGAGGAFATFIAPIPWLGLTPSQRKQMIDLVDKAGAVKSKVGPPPGEARATTIKF